MLNKVILIGRLTSDIELRYSNDQMPYTYFTLAITRQGQRDKTDFISCVAFRSTAELMARYLGKGSMISVEGRLEVYRTEANGEYQTRTNVVVNNISFLDSRRSSNQDSSNQNMTFAQNNFTDNTNFNSNQPTEISSDNDDSSNEEFDFENFEIKI